jgi:hypothetical protein
MLEEARRVAEEAERTAREYAQKRPLEAQKRFERIRNQVVARQRLDQYHEELAALLARELELFDLAEQAKARAREVEENVRKTEDACREATREVNKFKEHRAIWQQEEAKRLEAIQEQEVEEIAGITAQRRRKAG